MRLAAGSLVALFAVLQSPEKNGLFLLMGGLGTHRAKPPCRWALTPAQEESMLYYAIVFFVIALIAAFFGFSGIAAGAAGIGKILFIGFMVLAVISGLAMLIGGRRRLP
jgi:uncharacterized membrane protein YtjA (UPF0391 family)